MLMILKGCKSCKFGSRDYVVVANCHRDVSGGNSQLMKVVYGEGQENYIPILKGTSNK